MNLKSGFNSSFDDEFRFISTPRNFNERPFHLNADFLSEDSTNEDHRRLSCILDSRNIVSSMSDYKPLTERF